jgi:hypothetical protein
MERRDALHVQGAMSLVGRSQAAACAGVTMTFALKGHAARGAVEEWDLYTLPSRPAPAPAATPPSEDRHAPHHCPAAPRCRKAGDGLEEPADVHGG